MGNEELLQKILDLHKGDKIAFEEIYKALKVPMYTIILRITQDRALSEDILQEVFIKLYQSPPRASVKNPRAYIFQMGRNLAIDHVRKQLEFNDLEILENLVYLPTDDFSIKMDIEQAMKTLSLEESQIVSLHINGGFKFREIADMMNIPLGTALWRYQKSVKKLRFILDGGIV